MYSKHEGKEFGKFVRTAGKFFNDEEQDKGMVTFNSTFAEKLPNFEPIKRRLSCNIFTYVSFYTPTHSSLDLTSVCVSERVLRIYDIDDMEIHVEC